ncbi:MAG TPA: prepilin peptidase [Rubrobacteraceae bacterium]|nr:prepilin peptidase [Rubrobacteraceae bacterium]
MITVLAALLGLLVGSFLNVVIHRVPRHESIVWPSSRCPKCGAEISPLDNVPVLSYVLLRGKCRNCGARISARYPLVEALTGVLFGVAAWRFGIGAELAGALVLIAVLVALAGIDLEHRLLPNVIVGPAALAGLLLSTLAAPAMWWVYLVSAVAVAGGLLGLALVYPGGMGMGDVKMGGMLGAFLGPYAALAVFIGALVGALVGGVLISTGKMRRRTAMPFGVFLALGGVVALLAGREMWSFYLDFAGGA